MTIIAEDGNKNVCMSYAAPREDVSRAERASGATNIIQIPREPVMGIEPMTTVLPRLCATAAPHGLVNLIYVGVGSGGFEPPKLAQLIYSQSHLATLVTAQLEEHTYSSA